MIVTSSFFSFQAQKIVIWDKSLSTLLPDHQFSTSSTAAIVISTTSIITTSFFQRAIPLTDSNSQIICITNMISPSDFEAVSLVHSATDFSNEQNRDLMFKRGTNSCSKILPVRCGVLLSETACLASASLPLCIRSSDFNVATRHCDFPNEHNIHPNYCGSFL